MENKIVNYHKKVFGFLFFVSFFVIVKIFFGTQYSANAQPQATSTLISPTITSTQMIVVEDDTEILVLKAQLEDIKEYDKNLLSTVHWSLGIVITTLIVIIGTNWFTTYSQYQKGLKEFKQDIEKTVSDETIRIQKAITTSMNQKYDDLVKKDEELIQSKFSSIEDEMLNLKVLQAETEATYWENRSIPVYENAVRKYVNMIDLDPNHATIENTLTSLENAIDKCSKMSPLTIQKVEDSINKTIGHQKTLSEQVLKKLQENVAK